MADDVPLKLHVCSIGWIKLSIHPCWTVQHALDDAGTPYERVTHPVDRRKRQAMIEATGQPRYPAIEFPDGSFYRDESKEMAATIRAGKLADAPRVDR